MPDNPAWIVVAAVAVLGSLGKLIHWMGKMEEHRSSVSEFMGEIRTDIKQIFDRLPIPTVANGSPVRLTDLGRTIAKSLRAKEWAVSIATSALPEVVNKRPFEVEEFSRKYVETRLDPKFQDRVAACAYEFGTKRENVNSVLWVVLRDELLPRIPPARQ